MNDQKITLTGSGKFSELFPKEGIEVAPVRHGRWLCIDDFDDLDGYGMCSECMYNSFEPIDYVRDEWKYCPQCGARMDGERKE